MDPGTAAAMAAAGSTASAGVGSSFSFNFVLNILMSSSLNSMLSAIKNVQVIVHLTLLSVVVPANAQIFYGAIAEMVAFDPVEIDAYIDIGFKTRPDDDYELDEELDDEEASTEDETTTE